MTFLFFEPEIQLIYTCGGLISQSNAIAALSFDLGIMFNDEFDEYYNDSRSIVPFSNVEIMELNELELSFPNGGHNALNFPEQKKVLPQENSAEFSAGESSSEEEVEEIEEGSVGSDAGSFDPDPNLIMTERHIDSTRHFEELHIREARDRNEPLFNSMRENRLPSSNIIYGPGDEDITNLDRQNPDRIRRFAKRFKSFLWSFVIRCSVHSVTGIMWDP